MKKRNKILLIISSSVSAIILVVVIILIAFPILRTEGGIRRHLLRITPIGTSMEEVIRAAEDNASWTIRDIHEDSGVVLHHRHLFPLRGPATIYAGYPVVGEQSVRVHLGTYRIIIGVDVIVFYAFCENGKLIEIFVRREHDII